MTKWMKMQLAMLVAVLAIAIVPAAQAQTSVGITSFFTLQSVVTGNQLPRLILASARPGNVLDLRYLHVELQSTSFALASFSLVQTSQTDAVTRSVRYLLSDIHLGSVGAGGSGEGWYKSDFTLPLPADRADFYHQTGRSLGSVYGAFAIDIAGTTGRWTVTIGVKEEIR